MTTIAELKRRFVRRPCWQITNHARRRWATRWPEYNLEEQLAASVTVRKSAAKRIRHQYPGGTSSRSLTHSGHFLRAPCGAVFVLSRQDLRTIITVLPAETTIPPAESDEVLRTN